MMNLYVEAYNDTGRVLDLELYVSSALRESNPSVQLVKTRIDCYAVHVYQFSSAELRVAFFEADKRGSIIRMFPWDVSVLNDDLNCLTQRVLEELGKLIEYSSVKQLEFCQTASKLDVEIFTKHASGDLPLESDMQGDSTVTVHVRSKRTNFKDLRIWCTCFAADLKMTVNTKRILPGADCSFTCEMNWIPHHGGDAQFARIDIWVSSELDFNLRTVLAHAQGDTSDTKPWQVQTVRVVQTALDNTTRGPLLGKPSARVRDYKGCIGNPHVIVAFVHGFFGDIASWKVEWRDWLQQQFPRMQQLDIVHTASRGVGTIDELASEIHYDLNLQGVLQLKLPIVWIAHSMGGLIAKSLFCKFDDILQLTRGFVFFATPHMGPVGWLHRGMKALGYAKVTSLESLATLKDLQELQSKFASELRKSECQVPILAVLGGKDVWVDHSSSRYVADGIIPPLVVQFRLSQDACHRSVKVLQSRDCDIYNDLKDIVQNAISNKPHEAV